jgi:hypothetical protein
LKRLTWPVYVAFAMMQLAQERPTARRQCGKNT